MECFSVFLSWEKIVVVFFIQLCKFPQQINVLCVTRKKHTSYLTSIHWYHPHIPPWCLSTVLSTHSSTVIYTNSSTHRCLKTHLCIRVFLGNMSGEVVFAIELEMAHPALVFKGGIVSVFPLVSYPSPNVCKPLATHWTNSTPRQVTATKVMTHVLVHRNINLLIHTLKISVLQELAPVSHSEGRETVCIIHTGMQTRQSSTCPTEQKHVSF